MASIQDEIDTLGVASNFASVALIFRGRPVIGERDIRVDFATDALANYQKIIAAMVASDAEQGLSSRGPLRGADLSRLFIRDMVRGSVGFVLEELPPSQAQLFPSKLKIAVEKATALMASLSSESVEVFESAIGDTQPRLVQAVQKFVGTLATWGASASLVGDENRAELSSTVISILMSKLGEIEIVEESDRIHGVLLGILPDGLRFELRLPGEGSQVLTGAVTEELASRYAQGDDFRMSVLLRSVNATIRRTKSQRRNGGLVREQLCMEDVVPSLSLSGGGADVPA